MRIVLMVMLMLLGLPLCALAENYVNPIPVTNDYGSKLDAADPFVLRHNGRYYLYTTGAEEIRVYESVNLADWTYRGFCTRNGEGHIAYAPEVIYWRGAFWMVTSPWGNGHYIMRSDSPLGPFDRVTGNFGFSIDGSLIAADDGSLYMLNLPQNQSIGVIQIDPETMTPAGINRATGVTLKHWTEGPGLIRRDGWWYLTFTGNHYLSSGYRVAWASRKGDFNGRFTQPEDHTLFISSVHGEKFTGLGHSASFIGPDLDSIYASYHCHAPVQTGGGLVRWYCVDRLLTNGGALYSTGASNFPMPVPAMPDVYGDAQGEMGGFTRTAEGILADVSPAVRFTQECNFTLNGGVMAWRMGTRGGHAALITTDGAQIAFTANGQVLASAKVPELGAADRLHTLRTECTAEVLYVYIDGMRLLSVENPGVTADTIGALLGENVSYSFMAHTAKALGDSDDDAVKAIPGRFAAVHALNGSELPTLTVGELEEEAAILGRADYRVRVAQDGAYCFDLTVCTADAGKEITLLLDGETVGTLPIPELSGDENGYAVLTSGPMGLPQGDHILTLAAEDVSLLTVSAFAYEAMPEMTWNFSDGNRQGIVTCGNFALREGALCVSQGQSGFAMTGTQGCTDYEMRAAFDIPVKGSGFSGFLLHATHVSHYDAQVAESAFGLAVALTRTGLTVREMNYGFVGKQHKVKIDGWNQLTQAEITLRMQDNTLTIWANGGEEPVFTLRDASPYTHGMCGVYSTGKELRVREMSVRPLP